MNADTIIRAPHLDELPQLAELGREFHRDSAYGHLPYDIPSMMDTLNRMLEQRLFMVAETENRIIGAVGGVSSGIFFNANIRIGCERFWWVEHSSRGAKVGVALLQAIEQCAWAAECDEWIMLSLEGDHGRAAAIYQYFGYTPVERAFIKRNPMRKLWEP